MMDQSLIPCAGALLAFSSRSGQNDMTKVFSIFERLGRGGGGKINAVYKRLNCLAQESDYAPVLLNLSHDLRQKENFAELVETGRIHPNVRHLSYVELCQENIATPQLPYFQALPKASRRKILDDNVTYFNGQTPVYQDWRQQIGNDTVVTTRLFDDTGVSRIQHTVNGTLYQIIDKRSDGRQIVSNFRNGVLVARYLQENRSFKWGHNHLSDQRFQVRERFLASFAHFIFGKDSVTFIDGITSAYLARSIRTPKVLFLHADHRHYDGNVNGRTKGFIQGFDGCVIATATARHKEALEKDITPAAPIQVIPHYSEAVPSDAPKSNRIVTISRLDLTGKPIDQCIRAFDLIRRKFPDHQYQIFGDGKGEQALQALIAELGCAEQVSLMGYTTDPAAEFARARLSLYPTLAEGFGLSILESLTQGCPVISYDVDYGPREMIQPGLNGELVPPGEITQLAAAIERVLRQPDHYARHAADNLSRFSRAKHDAGYRRIVQFALHNTPFPPAPAAVTTPGPVCA